MVADALNGRLDVRPLSAATWTASSKSSRLRSARTPGRPKLFLEYWRESPELFLIARRGRRIAGYSITRLNWRGAELESIAVDPRYRGRGVAQALLDATVAQLSEPEHCD